MLPALNKNSLLSVPTLADAGYTTIFQPHQQGVEVYKGKDVTIQARTPPVLQGCREMSGLWTVNAKYKQKEQANTVYDLPSIPKAILFLHAAAGFPVKETWLKAIKNGHYDTWPGLTPEAVAKHCPDAAETHKGHMKKQSQNVRSTRIHVHKDDEKSVSCAKNKMCISKFSMPGTQYIPTKRATYPSHPAEGINSLWY